MLRASRAFTLIELLTVIAIIGILAAIIIGAGRRAAESGRIARTQAELAALSTALEAYKRQYGDYPRTSDSRQLLQALVGRLDPNRNLPATSGRVLLDLALFAVRDGADPLTNTSAVLLDPWDTAYAYTYKMPAAKWTNPSFVLYSLGPDQLADDTLNAGGYPNRDADLNLDNLYASPWFPPPGRVYHHRIAHGHRRDRHPRRDYDSHGFIGSPFRRQGQDQGAVQSVGCGHRILPRRIRLLSAI